MSTLVTTPVTNLKPGDLVYVGGGMTRLILDVSPAMPTDDWFEDSIVVSFKTNGGEGFRMDVAVAPTALYSKVA